MTTQTMINKYSKKQIIINRYQALITINYEMYINNKGTGSQSDYDLFCAMNSSSDYKNHSKSEAFKDILTNA